MKIHKMEMMTLKECQWNETRRSICVKTETQKPVMCFFILKQTQKLTKQPLSTKQNNRVFYFDLSNFESPHPMTI